jgi:hypothetical protein
VNPIETWQQTLRKKEVSGEVLHFSQRGATIRDWLNCCTSEPFDIQGYSGA